MICSAVGFGSIMRSVRLLQIPAQMHIEGEYHAHNDERTRAQDQEPPDHPHSRLG
jgi:hypothetical protein